MRIGARDSLLSKAQVEEILQELKHFWPQLSFSTIYLKTRGDIDQTTSLRTLGSCDFFTRELDELLLSEGCDFVVHSAKDLPHPLTSGLKIAALTRGADPSDVLVLRRGEELSGLKPQAKIAASSLRRELALRALRPDLEYVDIRGAVDQRVERLWNGEIDGLVVANAALIRLGYKNLNTMKLECEVPTLQGRLALVIREEHQEMLDICAPLNHLVSIE